MIEPFCVMSVDITDYELCLILEKCVQLGAAPCHWHQERVNDNEVYIYGKDDFLYWGVAVDLCTTTSDRGEGYDKNLLTKDEAFEMLGITNQKPTLKPDWGSAPEWAKYVAMDKDGAWYWYEFEPTRNCLHREWRHNGGKTALAAKSNNAWLVSLDRRP